MSQTSQQFKISQRLKRRLIAFLILILALLVVMVIRLFQIQIIRGAEYLEKSQRVIRKVIPLPAPRGEMFDRNYDNRESAVKIVSNKGTKELIAIPGHFKGDELKKSVERLEKVLHRNPGSIWELVGERKIAKNDEVVLIEGLSEDDATIIADYYLAFPKFIIRQNISRYYEMGNAAAHITGFIGPPAEKEIKAGIQSYQKVGKNGIESQYDSFLRGEDGEIVQLKTSRIEAEEQKVFKKIISGNDLILTIDYDLQMQASKSMEGKQGAVVVLHAATGEILAMVSKPDFDPNILVSFDKDARREHLEEITKSKAELNRAISAKYPPASSFKPLVALAALEERRFTENQSFNCPGHFTLKSTNRGSADTTFFDWSSHGTLDMISAIAQSCSVYFFQLGYKMGSEPIMKYSRHFLLDQKTDIDLPAEVSGFVPSSLWKEKQFNQRWYDGDTVNMSVGQGFVQTTVMAMVNFYAALVNDGVVYKPHLVKEIRSPSQNDLILEKVSPKLLYSMPISRSSLEIINKGLRQVVTNGTARGIFAGSEIAVAGKTGTVQTKSDDRKDAASQHAWFIGYGPFEGEIQSQIVIGVFVEFGQGGSVGAAPVARDLFNVYNRKLKKKSIKL